jgi:hypothetical protein
VSARPALSPYFAEPAGLSCTFRSLQPCATPLAGHETSSKQGYFPSVFVPVKYFLLVFFIGFPVSHETNKARIRKSLKDFTF